MRNFHVCILVLLVMLTVQAAHTFVNEPNETDYGPEVRIVLLNATEDGVVTVRLFANFTAQQPSLLSIRLHSREDEFFVIREETTIKTFNITSFDAASGTFAAVYCDCGDMCGKYPYEATYTLVPTPNFTGGKLEPAYELISGGFYCHPCKYGSGLCYTFVGNPIRTNPIRTRKLPSIDIRLQDTILPAPLIYTTRGGAYERVFTPADNVELHLVSVSSNTYYLPNQSILWNYLNMSGGNGNLWVVYNWVNNRTVRGTYTISIMDLEGQTKYSANTVVNVSKKGPMVVNLSIRLDGFSSGRYIILVTQNCSSFSGSTKTECERRNREEPWTYAFFVDELGVPAWSRDLRMLNIGDPMGRAMDGGTLETRYPQLIWEAKSYGFNTLYGVEYYQYNWLGANQPVVKYWIPSGTSSDTHYSTPPKSLVEQTGSVGAAQNKIGWMVNITHDNGLRFIGYMEPMFIFSPNPSNPLAACEDGLLTTCYSPWPQTCCQHDTHVAHHNATAPSYVRYENGVPRRVTWQEGSTFGASISNVYDIGVEASFCSAPESENPSDSFTNDPNYPSHLSHEVGWLSQNYGFDGVVLDDIGRADMKFEAVPSDLSDASSAIRAVQPSDTYYCSPLNTCCSGSGQQTLDSISASILSARRQSRSVFSDKIVIISDYVAAKDAGWDSLYGASDVYSSDQYFLTKPSFARYALTNWNASFKPMKTDMRRALPDLQIPFIGTTIPLTNREARMNRPAWLRGVLTGVAWSNRVNMEVTYSELAERCNGSEQDTCLLFTHYHAMRDAASAPELPIFSTQVSQDLLYHSSLEELRTNELEYCGTSDNGECSSAYQSGQPYSVLYRLPGPEGERARILHVINTRAFCAGETDMFGDCQHPLDNSAVPSDYYFKVRIPEGYEVEKVVLVSPDVGLPYLTPKYRNYSEELPSPSPAMYDEDGYLKIRLTGDDKVATYTIVYISLKPKWS